MSKRRKNCAVLFFCLIAPPVACPTLFADEMKSLAAYRSVADRTQLFLYKLAVNMAAKAPRRHAPSLRLIDGTRD